MKLAVISNMRGCQWAGSETVWHLAAMLALKEGHSVTAFLHPDLATSSQIAEFRDAGGSVRAWKPFPIARFQGVKEAICPGFPQSLLNRFDSILVSLGSLPSLTYVPGLVEGLLATKSPILLLCLFNSDLLVINAHERRLVAEILKKSAACVFVSQRNLEEARRQFAMEPPHARVLMNPVRNRNADPCPWPESSSSVCFASVARFDAHWKGQDLLLEVLSKPQWEDRDWHLSLYGTGPDEAHLRNLVESYNLAHRVSFNGFEKQISAIWKDKHLLVMPSRGEGTPLAALEAMMAGRPVVATDVGGNAEVIQDGVTGFIAEAATVPCFSQAMERAWHKRKNWSEMGLAAHNDTRSRCADDPSQTLLKAWLSRIES